MTIINPWVFYLIDVLSGLNLFLWIIGGVCVVLSFLCIDLCSSYDEEIEEMAKKCIKISLSVFTCCCIGIVLIPSKETMYQMVVANFVTHENIETATDVIKDSVDYIFEKIDNDE